MDVELLEMLIDRSLVSERFPCVEMTRWQPVGCWLAFFIQPCSPMTRLTKASAHRTVNVDRPVRAWVRGPALAPYLSFIIECVLSATVSRESRETPMASAQVVSRSCSLSSDWSNRDR